jgi:hypothetical protein
MMRKKQGEEWGKDSMNSDGQQVEKKVRLRSNDEKHCTGIHDWSNTNADTNRREEEMRCCDRERTMVSNGKHTLFVIEKWAY